MFELDETTGEILTERLRLRPPGHEDAEAIFERYSGDPEVTRYLAWPRHRSSDEAREFLRFSEAEWQQWPAGPYLIESRPGGELLGGTGLAFETDYRASTGFALTRDAWGQGYAGEALAAMVTLAERTGVQRLYALCHSEHQASIRVLERGGFLFEGILHHYLRFPNLTDTTAADVDCYARVFEVSPR
jgi:ribosomal-protein-alanine N-acetyltransferase